MSVRFNPDRPGATAGLGAVEAAVRKLAQDVIADAVDDADREHQGDPFMEAEAATVERAALPPLVTPENIADHTTKKRRLGHHLPGMTIGDEPASDRETPPPTDVSGRGYHERSSW